MKKLFISVLICSVMIFLSLAAMAQNEVSNIRVQSSENLLIVTYDLDVNADIEAYVSLDNGVTFIGPLLHVTGAVGKNIAAEKDKIFVWDAEKEVGNVDVTAFIKIVAIMEHPKTSDTKSLPKPNVNEKNYLRQVMQTNPDALQLLNNGFRQKNAGLWCILSSPVFLSIGIGLIATNDFNVGGEMLCMLPGTGMFAIGSLLLQKGNKTITEAVDTYNSGLSLKKTSMWLDFGITGNSVGFVLRF